MSLFLDYSQEEAFQKVMDYFLKKRCKILMSTPPSLIKAEFGAYYPMAWTNAKSEVEATVTKGDNGSYVNFTFDFRKSYIFLFVSSLVASLLFLLLRVWRTSIDYASEYPIFLVVAFSFFIIAILLGRYSANLTRRKFIEEFGRFAELLPHPIDSSKR